MGINLKFLPPVYYNKLKISDNSNDIHLDVKNIETNLNPDNYAVFKNEFGMIRKIIHYNKICQIENIYEYSNKGNLILFIYTNRKGFRIKERYDYTHDKKTVLLKDFYFENKHVKREKFKKNILTEIDYYMDGFVYCTEFFNNDKHPYKVDYYNQAGLKI